MLPVFLSFAFNGGAISLAGSLLLLESSSPFFSVIRFCHTCSLSRFPASCTSYPHPWLLPFNYKQSQVPYFKRNKLKLVVLLVSQFLSPLILAWVQPSAQTVSHSAQMHVSIILLFDDFFQSYPTTFFLLETECFQHFAKDVSDYHIYPISSCRFYHIPV